MAGEKTVHDVTHDLVRSLGLTTVFGNPGSTGQKVLAEFSGRIDRCTGLRIHR
jgi:benzoylformate decarboxylase